MLSLSSGSTAGARRRGCEATIQVNSGARRLKAGRSMKVTRESSSISSQKE